MTGTGAANQPHMPEQGWWILAKVVAFIAIPSALIYLVKVLLE
jgi:hypothetical protein